MRQETTLHTKYRPNRLEDVLGQNAVVNSVAEALQKRSCRAFLMVGPSGVGKTTIARIIARMVGCDDTSILEIDAATHSSVEAMREVVELMRYTSIGSSPARVVIVDEAHALSKAAWQSLLKSVEEPPPSGYWVFCSTEPKKIPDTIRTRCACYLLKPLSIQHLTTIGRGVVRVEGKKISDYLLDRLVRKAEGSARRLLTLIAKCPENASDKEVLALAEAIDVEEGGSVLQLCQALVKGVPWSTLMRIVDEIEEPSEAIRIAILAYFGKMLQGANSDAKAIACLTIMDNFSEPYEQSYAKPLLLISLGRSVFHS